MNFNEEVLNVQGKVLVDFYTDSCAPCRAMVPVMEELAKEYNVKKVNAGTDEGAILACEYNISGVPSFLVFENGKEVKRFVGLQPKPRLIDALRD
jgi:thioredoxin 1